MRNLDLAAFELWQIRLEGGRFSDTLAGRIPMASVDGCSRDRAQALAVKRFGVPLPEDFVPSE